MRSKYRLSRILQTMPADGWWAVWLYIDGAGNGRYERDRVIGFALREEWDSTTCNQATPPETVVPERYVYPLIQTTDMGIDVIEATPNEDDCYYGLVHQDEWEERRPEITKRAAEFARKHAAEREQRQKQEAAR